MTTGPLQLVVIGFDQLDRFRGQILSELQEVRGRDVIRLLDLLFVAKDEAGQLTALEVSDLPEEAQASYGSLLGALVGQVEADEGAEAVRGAAIVNALAAVAEAELVEEAAAQAAVAATTIEEPAMRSATVADVVRVLVAAGVLEDTAALDAVAALVAAGLIDPALVDAAAREAPAVLATGPSGNGGDGG